MSVIPSLQLEPGKILLAGTWTLAAMQAEIPVLLPRLAVAHKDANAIWDLSRVERLDSAAATLLWRIWGEEWPESLVLPEALRGTPRGSPTLCRLRLCRRVSGIPGWRYPVSFC